MCVRVRFGIRGGDGWQTEEEDEEGDEYDENVFEENKPKSGRKARSPANTLEPTFRAVSSNVY